MEAVLWGQANLRCVLGTDWQTLRELAVGRNGAAMSEYSTADCALRATIRPLNAVLRNREGVLNDPGGVSDSTRLQTKRNIGVRLVAVHNGGHHY